MKITFKGWRREKKIHARQIAPIEALADGNQQIVKNRTDLRWHGPFAAYGRVSGLALSGAFLVEFNFEEVELKNWLSTYCKARPESAIRLLAAAQAEAIVALTSKSAATDLLEG